MTYAPDDNVPPEASRYKPLPILVRCVECMTPIMPIEEYQRVESGRVVRGLCRRCAMGEEETR